MKTRTISVIDFFHTESRAVKLSLSGGERQIQYMYLNDEHGIFMKSYKLIRLERPGVCNLN